MFFMLTFISCSELYSWLYFWIWVAQYKQCTRIWKEIMYKILNHIPYKYTNIVTGYGCDALLLFNSSAFEWETIWMSSFPFLFVSFIHSFRWPIICLPFWWKFLSSSFYANTFWEYFRHCVLISSSNQLILGENIIAYPSYNCNYKIDIFSI